MRNYFLFKRKLFIYLFLLSLISLYKLGAKGIANERQRKLFSICRVQLALYKGKTFF